MNVSGDRVVDPVIEPGELAVRVFIEALDESRARSRPSTPSRTPPRRDQAVPARSFSKASRG